MSIFLTGKKPASSAMWRVIPQNKQFTNLPKGTLTMKLNLATKFITFGLFVGVLAAHADIDWEALPIAPRDDETSEWWMRTWNTGDVVSVTSRYQFEGKLTIKKEDLKKVKWYELAKRFVGGEMAVRIDGVSRCTTAVLVAPPPNSDEETQLLRAFDACPISARAVGTVGLRNGIEAEKSVRRAIDHFYEELRSPEAQEAIDTGVKYLSIFAHAAATASVMAGAAAGSAVAAPATGGASLAATAASATVVAAKAEAAGRLAELATQWICRKTTEIAGKKIDALKAANLQTLAGDKFASYGDTDIRGVEAKRDSWFYKNMDDNDAERMKNIAMALNSLFDGSRFYIAGSKGETVFAKRLDGASAENVFRDGVADIATLPEKMRDIPLTPEDYRVSSIFARETLNVNAELFDMRKRKVGEVWPVDASLLNNFLHPDLEGEFEGTIFMKYSGDQPISLTSFPEAAELVFQTRHLVMLPYYKGKASQFAYKETGFKIEYDPEKQKDTAVSIWVDKNSGHVVKSEAHINGNVAALPKLALFKGFSLYDSKGKLVFDMSAEGLPQKALPEISE